MQACVDGSASAGISSHESQMTAAIFSQLLSSNEISEAGRSGGGICGINHVMEGEWTGTLAGRFHLVMMGVCKVGCKMD